MSTAFINDYYESYDGENNEKIWNATTSTIFVVDVTKLMHDNDRLLFCLQAYRNIARRKCSDNKKDKMGLVVFGTKETNCQVDNVTELQKFETVSIDTLKNIEAEIQNINKYKELASSDKYPLYNALSYAFQKIHASKGKTTSNTILLCTCHDNPKLDGSVECRRLENLVASFKDAQVKLLVAGLSDLWNDTIFYKDLQIISGTFADNNYKKINLEDLEQAISSPARSICKLPWKITSNLAVQVSLKNIISKYKYPSKIKMRKDNNEILEIRKIFQEFDPDNIKIEQSMETTKRGKIISAENIIYCKSYCGMDANFKPFEIKKIKNLCSEISIETLAFKPIACDPLYHVKSAYFVSCTTDCKDENKMLFRSFISQCCRKKVMPICKVATNQAFYIGIMIPSEDDGGFYLYKIPFSDKVRDLDSRFSHFVFNSEKQCPVNEEAVDVFKKLIELSTVKFDLKIFKNPKLEKYLAHIEALALDKELSPLPPDKTLPPQPVNSEVEQLSTTLKVLLDLKDKNLRKRPMIEKSNDNKKQKMDVDTTVKSKKLHMLTVVQLKEILKDMKQSTVGNKSLLIERIYKYYNN